ncbi:hypothetical protein EDD86DRAFT_248316 [Gorgonomyces haynaldii]|nr:hypothetical protein EDD86DRAFT_248316 [Gorgonomyces haynaldii]
MNPLASLLKLEQLIKDYHDIEAEGLGTLEQMRVLDQQLPRMDFDLFPDYKERLTLIIIKKRQLFWQHLNQLLERLVKIVQQMRNLKPKQATYDPRDISLEQCSEWIETVYQDYTSDLQKKEQMDWNSELDMKLQSRIHTRLPYICTSAQFVSFQRDFRSRTILVLLDGKAPHLTLPSKQILYCTLFEDELLTLPSKPTSIVCLKDDFLKKTIRGFPHVAGVPLDCFLLVDGGIAQDTRIKHLQRPDWLSFREIGHIYYRNRSTGLCGFLYMDLDSIRLFVVGSVRDMLLMPHLDGFDYYGQSMLLQWQEMVCESVLQIRKIDNLVMFNLKLASHYHTIVCVEAHGDVELSIARMLSQTSVFCVCVCKSGSLPRTPRSIVFLDTDMHSVRQEIDPVRCRSLFLKAKLDLISFKCFQTSFLFPPPSIGPSLGPQLLWLEDAFSFAPKSLIAYLKMWSVQKSQDLAFHSLNYHQLYQNSLLIAGYLLDHMRSHEILLVLESQKIEFVQVLIGCMMSGIICFVTKCVPNDDVLDRFNIKHCWNVKCRLQSLKGRKKRDLEIDPICAQVCLIYYDQEPIWITHEILVDRMRQLTTLIDDTAFKSRKFVVCSKNVEFVLLGLYNGLEIHWILYDRWLSQAKEQAFEMGLIHLSDWNTIPKTHVMQHFKTLLIITQDPYLIQPVDHYMNLESLSVLFYDRRFGLINAQPYDNDSQSFDPLGLEYDLVVPQKQTRSSIIIQPLSQLFASVAIGDTMLLDDYRVGKIHFKSQMCHLGRESQIHGTDGFLFSGFHGFVYQQSLFIADAMIDKRFNRLCKKPSVKTAVSLMMEDS